MNAVLGIYDYYNYTKDSRAKLLFDNGITALKASIASDDNNGYSYYDILKRPPDEKYHKIHVILLERLYRITNEEIFKLYHEKWAAYQFPLMFSKTLAIITFVAGTAIGELSLFIFRRSHKKYTSLT